MSLKDGLLWCQMQMREKLETEPSEGGTYCLFTEQSGEELMETLNRSGAFFALLPIPHEDAMRLVEEDRERFAAAEKARKQKRKPKIRVFYASDGTFRREGWHWVIKWPNGNVWRNRLDEPRATYENALVRACRKIDKGYHQFPNLFRDPPPRPFVRIHNV